MKKFLIFISLLIAANFSFAQNRASVNFALRSKLMKGDNGNEKMFLLVKGDVKKIQQFVETNHGKFLNSAGDIASIRLSLNAISVLIEKPFVKRIGSDVHHYVTLNDTMRMRSHVNEVHNGQAPLTQSYKGRGVLLGIIDSGIDLAHPDFKDSTGHTRVKWLWDMALNDSANSPHPYDYGQEFSGDQIDSGLASAHLDTSDYGHGTYVTGIAAGNGSAVGRFTGVAPESDLIIVAMDFAAQDTVPRMSHAVDYIFKKAQQLGKPCVINASLGDYNGSHDGLDLESQYISNLLNQQSGRVMVAACGNIGVNWPYHLQKNSVSGDTSFTWFNFTPSIGACYVQIFADTADFRNIRFAIGADKVNPYFDFRGRTAFTSVIPSINNPIVQNLMNGSNRIGMMQTYTTINEGVYSIEITVLPDSQNYYWRFITTGNGKFDSWTLDIKYPCWVYQNLPTVSTFPDMAHYQLPDTFQTIVSGFNCLDNVLSVGNYNNTDRHYDVDSVLHVDTLHLPQEIAPNSGRGPTRDGRNKPDILAPGNYIISAGVQELIPTLTHNKIAEGGYHITGGGTSASAPVVAGVAALYLEENPNANWLDVKTAITNCAYQDAFTWGPYPNNAWGYGKVNAFEALTTCSLVNSVHHIYPGDNSFFVYPNPASTYLNVEISGGERIDAAVYDIDGRKLIQSVFKKDNFSIPVSTLNNGVYLLELKSEKGYRVMKRFIISK